MWKQVGFKQLGFISLFGLVAAGCSPVGAVMWADPALSQKEGRECRITNAFSNLPICPAHVTKVQDRELYCIDSLGGPTCYASDPRENPLETRNTYSPLVADQVDIVDPSIPDPRDIASGRDAVDDIEILTFPARAIGTGVPVMNQPR